MKRRLKFSIADLMAVVLIVAIDCGLIGFHGQNFLILPEVTLLLFGLTRLGPGHASRFFWRGFEAVGWIAVGLSLALYQGYKKFDALNFLVEPAIWIETTGRGWRSGTGFIYTCALIVYAGPQLVMATIAGWFTARYRLVRRTPHDAEVRIGPHEVQGRIEASAWSGADRDG